MEILDIFDQQWVTEVTNLENERNAKEMAEKAAKEAREEERINTILSLYKKNMLSKENTCKELNLTEDQLDNLL